ncbi:RDD family protein [Actinomadura sp. SCN-SB]|uniref:RDD family protein n=1 Tax=Actinomadura sp. SCN-SB TaxID=3373092 RepID=UPI0037529DB4
MTQPQPAPGEQPPPYDGAYGQVPQGPSPYSQLETGQPYGAVPGYGAGSYGGLASRWARLGAFVLDTLLVGVVSTTLSLPFMDLDAMLNPSPDAPLYTTGDVVNTVLSTVLGFFYYWLMTARWGQTLGKMALSIRVVREQDGGAIGYGTSAWRYGVQILLAIPCGIGTLLDVLWLFFDRRKQMLHDKAARTLVVKVEPGMPNPYAQPKPQERPEPPEQG